MEEDSRSAVAARLAKLAALLPESFGTAAKIRDELKAAPAYLASPVRLAVAGQIKRGKSTLVNALLNRDIAATGQLELTFNVTEFLGGRPQDLILYLDEADGPSRHLPLDQLRLLTANDPANLDLLRRIARIVVVLDHFLLDQIVLIDTPGLGSVYGEDSARAERILADDLDTQTVAALRRLGRTEAEVALLSQYEVDRADAVLYMFSRDPGLVDKAAVSRFLRHDVRADPAASIRAFGVLSRCDESWSRWAAEDAGIDPVDYNPIERVARPRINRYLANEPDIAELFHTIVPVAGLVAAGAQMLTAELFQWLDVLAAARPERWVDWFESAARFISPDMDEVPVPMALRRQLMGMLGPWGMVLACGYIHAGCKNAEVVAQMVDCSGIAEVRDLVRGHFAHQAYVVKLDEILENLDRFLVQLDREDRARGGHRGGSTRKIADALTDIRDGEPGFTEMEIRRDLFHGRLMLSSADTARLSRLLGGAGEGCAQRLGVHEQEPPLSLLAAVAHEEVRYWRHWSGAGVANAATRSAVDTLIRTAEDVLYRVTSAQSLLAWRRRP
jgi:Dynamin family